MKDAYTAQGLPYYHILDTAVQCKNSVGCRVSGAVVVSKVENGEAFVSPEIGAVAEWGRMTRGRGVVASK